MNDTNTIKNMHKGEIIWRVCFVLLSIVALFAYTSEPSRRYDAKWDAFLSCAIHTEAAICAQLFGN